MTIFFIIALLYMTDIVVQLRMMVVLDCRSAQDDGVEDLLAMTFCLFLWPPFRL